MSWTYPAGQCTDYVAQQLPWIAAAGDLGDAWSWTAAWKARGLPTTATPTVGAAVCFQPFVGGAFGTGHVAVVTAVNPQDGTFTISEQNATRGLGQTDERSGMKAGFGVTFLLPADNAVINSPSVAGLSPASVKTVAASSGGGLFDFGPFLGLLVNGGEIVIGGLMFFGGLWILEKPIMEKVPGSPDFTTKTAKQILGVGDDKKKETANTDKKQSQEDERLFQQSQSYERTQQSHQKAHSDFYKAKQSENQLALAQHQSKDAAAARARQTKASKKALKTIPF